MTKIGGYPHWYYLAGVITVFAVVGLGQAIADWAGVDGWAATGIWIGSLIVGFGAAQQINSRLFRQDP